jgi:hypothetical protein
MPQDHMDFSTIANIAQIVSLLWTLIFGGYAIHEVLSRSSVNIQRPKVRIVVLLSLTFIILLIAMMIRVFTWVYLDPQPGSIDLQNYCTSLGYQENGQNELCVSPLTTGDLNAACTLQYGKQNQTFHLRNPNDATTGYCEDSSGKPEHGLDVDKYCNTNRNGGISEAVATGKTWQCEMKINMEIACIWMYGTTNIQARETNTTWSCYTQRTIW